MLFDAVSFLECLFKQNFCLVLFPSFLLCLVLLGILHPPWKKHLKFGAEFFINLAPMCWIDCPPTHVYSPQKKVHPILAQATTIFSEPPPWDSYLSQVVIFGDDFFDQNFQVQGVTSHEFAQTKKASQFSWEKSNVQSRKSWGCHQSYSANDVQHQRVSVQNLWTMWRLEKRMDWLDQRKSTHFGLGSKSTWSVF